MAMFEVNPTELIIKTAEKLKSIPEIKAPEWGKFVRTGHGRERPPVQDDWWHIRAAAILRKLVIKGPIGVNKLRVLFGNRKNYGFAPDHFAKAGGNIIRKILQQLEKAGLAKKEEKDVYKGRVASGKGISILDKAASEILKENPPVKLKVPEEKSVSEEIIEKIEKEKPKKKTEKKPEEVSEKIEKKKEEKPGEK